MDNQILLDAYKKKHSLIQEYYVQISKIESEKKAVGRKLKAVKKRFDELINAPEDVAQLKLFDIDIFLKNLHSEHGA